jgi:hypothetical protein
MIWQPIETAPKDGTTIRVRLSTGRETIAEYWSPPPPEIDPEQRFGGWAFDMAPVFDDPGSWDSEITHWMPLPESPPESPQFLEPPK